MNKLFSVHSPVLVLVDHTIIETEECLLKEKGATYSADFRFNINSNMTSSPASILPQALQL